MKRSKTYLLLDLEADGSTVGTHPAMTYSGNLDQEDEGDASGSKYTDREVNANTSDAHVFKLPFGTDTITLASSTKQNCWWIFKASSKKSFYNLRTYGTSPKMFLTISHTGTGFDIISATTQTTGLITVQLYSVAEDGSTNVVKSTLVDTYYGCEYVDTNDDGVADTWVPDEDASGALYQVPVIKMSGLTYGKYKVVITISYSDFLDHYTDDGAQYDFYLDAIRIYDPANDGEGNGTIQDAYVSDGEGWPEYRYK